MAREVHEFGKCLKMISKDHDEVKPKNIQKRDIQKQNDSVASSSEPLLLKP